MTARFKFNFWSPGYISVLSYKHKWNKFWNKFGGLLVYQVGAYQSGLNTWSVYHEVVPNFECFTLFTPQIVWYGLITINIFIPKSVWSPMESWIEQLHWHLELFLEVITLTTVTASKFIELILTLLLLTWSQHCMCILSSEEADVK